MLAGLLLRGPALGATRRIAIIPTENGVADLQATLLRVAAGFDGGTENVPSVSLSILKPSVARTDSFSSNVRPAFVKIVCYREADQLR